MRGPFLWASLYNNWISTQKEEKKVDNVRVVTVYMVMLNPSEKKAAGFNPVYVNAVVNLLSLKCFTEN